MDKESWELFDLSTDRTETKDLSAEFPERAQEMELKWNSTLEAIKNVTNRPDSD